MKVLKKKHLLKESLPDQTENKNLFKYIYIYIYIYIYVSVYVYIYIYILFIKIFCHVIAGRSMSVP